MSVKLPHVTRRTAIAGGVAALAAGAGVAFGVARCTRGDEKVPAEPTTSDSAEAGKRGGKLTLYTSCDDALVNALVPAFAQETGIVVDVIQKTCAECRDEVLGEVQAGRAIADVVWGGDASWYAAGEAAYEKYFSPENGSALDGCRNADGYATPVTREACAIVVNRALADELGVQIGGYAELTGEKCAGLVAMPDPATDSAGLTQIQAILAAGDAAAKADADAAAGGAVGEKGAGEAAAGAEPTAGTAAANGEPAAGEEPDPSGEEAEQELQDHGAELLGLILGNVGARVLATSEDVIEEVLSGQALAGLVYEQAAVQMAELTDELDVVYPAEGVAEAVGCSAIVRGCDNHEQARSWIDFATSEAGQRALVSRGPARSVREGVDARDGLPRDGELETLVPAREDALEVWASLRG